MAVMAMATGSVFANTNEYKVFLNNPVGSGPDVVVRKIQQLVKDQSGIALIIVNQGAAGGLLAARDFKNERLAVMIANTSQLIYGPLSGKNKLATTYGIEDFEIIADFGLGSQIWFTHPESGIKTPKDLVSKLPTLSNNAIGVASEDTIANARALVKFHSLTSTVVTFRNHNDTAIQVAGKHVPVGIASFNTESVYHLAKTGQLVIIGYTGLKPFSFKGFELAPVSRDLNLPPLFGGAWLTTTPGTSSEHLKLRSALLTAMKHPDVRLLLREAYPLGAEFPFQKIYETALEHQDLLK